MMEEILKMAEELNTLLWDMSCDYHDIHYDNLNEAQGKSQNLLKKLKEKSKQRGDSDDKIIVKTYDTKE